MSSWLSIWELSRQKVKFQYIFWRRRILLFLKSTWMKIFWRKFIWFYIQKGRSNCFRKLSSTMLQRNSWYLKLNKAKYLMKAPQKLKMIVWSTLKMKHHSSWRCSMIWRKSIIPPPLILWWSQMKVSNPNNWSPSSKNSLLVKFTKTNSFYQTST